MKDIRVFKALTHEFIDITNEEWKMLSDKYLEVNDLYNYATRPHEPLLPPWPIVLLTEKGFDKFKIFHEQYTISMKVEEALNT